MKQAQKTPEQRLVSLLTETELSYNAAEKAQFHRLGRLVLLELAKLLELPVKSYEVRSCHGGIAVSGEVILHGEWIYVQISQGPNLDSHVMFRTCRGREDYSGGTNNWLKVTNLLDLPGVARVMRAILPKPVVAGNT
jgi:hypothetical protein